LTRIRHEQSDFPCRARELGPTVMVRTLPAPHCQDPSDNVATAQNQRATEGAWSVARRRWQEGTVYLRRSKTLPDAYWGRYFKTVESEAGALRIQRNVRLGEARQLTKPLAKRTLRELVDRANNYEPVALRSRTIGKSATPFSVFATHWQADVLIHKKASTAATVRGHVNNLLIPAFGKMPMGDLDSERIQEFLNGLTGHSSPKTVKNIWTTIRIMWNSATAIRSEKRAALLGLHSFRHKNATAMDSLGIPQQLRKLRLGHSGNGVTESYTHTLASDERDAAEKLGELFGAGWPERGETKVVFFPKSFPNERKAYRSSPRSLCESIRLVAGVGFEPTTSGL